MRGGMSEAALAPRRGQPQAAPAAGPAQVAELGEASPCPLLNTFKTAWRMWSGRRMSRCGTETGGTPFPHRPRPENDRTALNHIS